MFDYIKELKIWHEDDYKTLFSFLMDIRNDNVLDEKNALETLDMICFYVAEVYDKIDEEKKEFIKEKIKMTIKDFLADELKDLSKNIEMLYFEKDVLKVILNSLKEIEKTNRYGYLEFILAMLYNLKTLHKNTIINLNRSVTSFKMRYRNVKTLNLDMIDSTHIYKALLDSSIVLQESFSIKRKIKKGSELK